MLLSFPHIPFLSQQVSPHQHNNTTTMSMPMPMPPAPPPPRPASMPHDDPMNMNHHAAMHMSFFWGKDVIVLFDGWPDNRLGMYILALAFVFLIALAVEVLSASPMFKAAEKRPLAGAAVHAGVYAVRTALAYLVMLAVMSFNVGVLIAAVAGHAVGYFVVKFRKLSAAASNISSPKV